MRSFAFIVLLIAPPLLLGLFGRPFIDWLRRRLHGITEGTDTFECGLRVVEGDLPGLSSRWRHGVGGVRGNELTWRQIPFSTTLTLHITSLDRSRMRPAKGREVIQRSPQSVAIPARVDDSAQIEIAVLRRDVERFLDLLKAPGV